MQILAAILTLSGILFSLLMAHQIVYFLIALPPDPSRRTESPPRASKKSAVLICARNEEAVIARLIDGLKNQTAPPDAIFVLADNCTDQTAAIARAAGALVYERKDPERIGKGWALSSLLGSIAQDDPAGFERYFVFDADNLPDPGCLAALHAGMDSGHAIVTGCRRSLNFGDNGLASSAALFFLRESRFLNGARRRLSISAAVSGTGFGFTREILAAQSEAGDPWPFHTLTEDIEFTAHHILASRVIGYAPDAVFYDEQPTRLSQSFRQRLRWSRGGLEVMAKYGGRLIRGVMGGSFACYDFLTAYMPSVLLNLIHLVIHPLCIIGGILAGDGIPPLRDLGIMLALTAAVFFFMGLVTLIGEWHSICSPPAKKLEALFCFPLYMLTYIPLSALSLFCRIGWKPTHHGRPAISLPIHQSKGNHHVQHPDLR